MSEAISEALSSSVLSLPAFTTGRTMEVLFLLLGSKVERTGGGRGYLATGCRAGPELVPDFEGSNASPSFAPARGVVDPAEGLTIALVAPTPASAVAVAAAGVVVIVVVVVSEALFLSVAVVVTVAVGSVGAGGLVFAVGARESFLEGVVAAVVPGGWMGVLSAFSFGREEEGVLGASGEDMGQLSEDGGQVKGREGVERTASLRRDDAVSEHNNKQPLRWEGV